MMKPAKRRALEAAGWKVGSADEFLGLTEVESRLVTAKLGMSRAVRRRRITRRLSQVQLARAIGSSQSRVAKLEAGDPGVSLELLLRALLTLGTPNPEIAAAIIAR
jgi:DNA-binding XRE family transcriptional regulator